MLFKRLFAVMFLTFAFLALLPLGSTLASRSVADDVPQVKLEAVGPNLLTNPGMDGKFVKQCSLRNGGQPWVQVPCPADYNAEVGDIKQWETTQVPAGWSAWWQQPNTNFDDPNYFNTYPHFCPDRQSTPINCKASSKPVRVGFKPTPWMVTSDPGVIKAATIIKAAEEMSQGRRMCRVRKVAG